LLAYLYQIHQYLVKFKRLQTLVNKSFVSLKTILLIFFKKNIYKRPILEQQIKKIYIFAGSNDI